MLLAALAVVVGFLLLAWGADRFVDGAAALARNFNVPSMIIGLTIVSLCTSFPEMLVSAMAAFGNNRDLGIGNAIGSNITNIGLVIGLTAIIAPLSVKSLTLRREFPVLFLVMFLAFALVADGNLNRFDGFFLAGGLILLLWWLVRMGRNERHDPLEEEFSELLATPMELKAALLWFAAGLAVLLVSSRIVVWGAVEIATLMGVSELVIGLTIVSIGTSLPELVDSVVSVRKNEADLAIGNIIGSNMFNILAVLSMPALIRPGAFGSDILLRDFPVMLLFTVALFVMAFGMRQGGVINRFEGLLLAGGYAGYLYLLYLGF